jgi:hypothetical protein
MKNDALTMPDSVESFLALLQGSANTLLQAAQMLVRLKAKDPTVIEKIVEAGASPRLLGDLLRVGEGSLAPALLFDASCAAKAIKRLPYSAQTEILKRGAIEVVVGNEEAETLMVPIHAATPEQVKQAIGPTGQLSRADQLAARRRAARPVTRDVDSPAYFARKDRLIINRPCELTRIQVIRLLEEMS